MAVEDGGTRASLARFIAKLTNSRFLSDTAVAALEVAAPTTVKITLNKYGAGQLPSPTDLEVPIATGNDALSTLGAIRDAIIAGPITNAVASRPTHSATPRSASRRPMRSTSRWISRSRSS